MHHNNSTAVWFWEKVDRSGGNDSCWLWTDHVNGCGYGKLSINGKSHLAHRIAYELIYGPIPTGLCVCHRCDVRNCCNPSHLFLGTQADNMHDKAIKGRAAHNHLIGERNPGAVFTERQVREIRARWDAGEKSRHALANEYGVSVGAIMGVVNRKSWAWLK